MDDERAEASLVRERALLLEALTLLMQRQARTDAELSDELARTSARVAAVERRSDELEDRLIDIDERLRRLAFEVEPDPGLPGRLAVLEGHVERLAGQGGEGVHSAPPPRLSTPQADVYRARSASPPDVRQTRSAPPPDVRQTRSAPPPDVRTPPPRFDDQLTPHPQPPPWVDDPPAPRPQPSPQWVDDPPAPRPQADVRAPAPEAAPPPPPPDVPTPRREPAAVRRQPVAPAGDTLWARLGSTNQDRASIVLIGAGVLAVAYALLAQVRFG